MKLTPLISLLGITLPLILAQDPANCNTECKQRNGNDFVLITQPDNANTKALSDLFKKSGNLVTVADVFNDGNHKMRDLSNPDLGIERLGWESKPDFDDANTEEWYPQGITSTADALGAGTYQGKDGYLVSWYRKTEDKNQKRVRISFVNKGDKTYRHALLVNPSAVDDFKTVDVHAGGIMWYGNTLWVADTNNGVRVFDMDNIWKVESGDGVGKKAGGGYSAAGYKYVIPQIRWYKWSSAFDFNFSFISLDRTSSPDSLLIGEYAIDNSPTRLVRLALDYTNRKLRATSTDGKTSKATWAYCVGIDAMQGAVQVGKDIYITSSNGKNQNGDMWGWTPGKFARENQGALPYGPEDLTYDVRDDSITTVTEWPGFRFIATYDRTYFKVGTDAGPSC